MERTEKVCNDFKKNFTNQLERLLKKHINQKFITKKLEEIETKLDSVLSEFANVVGSYVDGLNQLHERIGKIEEYIKQIK